MFNNSLEEFIISQRRKIAEERVKLGVIGCEVQVIYFHTILYLLHCMYDILNKYYLLYINA